VLSPDGKRVVFTFNENPPADKDGNSRKALFVRDIDGKAPGFKIEINALNASWSPDGKQLLVAEFLPAKDPKDMAIPAWLVDIGTKEKTSVDLPTLTRVFQFTPDGKSFVAAVYDLEARKVHLALISRDGKKITKLTSVRTENPIPKLSPDGTKILFLDDDPAEKSEKDMPQLARLFIYDIGAKKRERLADTALNSLILGHCWSPNGKQVAYTWKVVHPGVALVLNTENLDDPKLKTETESHLVIADVDGRNAKVVISAKANSAPTITIGNLDWR
jgi:Tol biopolymer transport system component